MIHRQIFRVGGKKEGRWVGAVEKRHADLSSAGSQGASILFFFPNLLPPTTLPCKNIKCNLYRYQSPCPFHRQGD
ncbi:hypothetical protein [Aneurinibacillus migulanus]|uniref:hypothetical protein n=1 Tax=Aneurinibacillus migulanus TaxID=47500 RepID=UPI001F3E8277|nr:hypothetical protein [Aneurinibacillus migulanus]